jgi:hypothetical protein
MVRCTDGGTDLGKVPYEPTERWPVRQQKSQNETARDDGVWAPRAHRDVRRA